MNKKFSFGYGSFNYLDGIPSQPMPSIDLGVRSPDYVKEALGIDGLRKELFPQISATFRYWQFAIWCEKHSGKISNLEISKIRDRVQGLQIGPKKMNGIKDGADWMKKLRELSVENSDYRNLVRFIEQASADVRIASPKKGFELCVQMTKSSRLNERWKKKIVKTFTPTARAFYYGKHRNPNLDVNDYLIGIVTGDLGIKDEKLVKAASIYGALRALYGYQEFEVDEFGKRKHLPRRGIANVKDEKKWAAAILSGIRKNKSIPLEVKRYGTALKETLQNPDGAIWHQTWKKTDGKKKLLLGFKFSRALAVVDKSQYKRGS